MAKGPGNAVSLVGRYINGGCYVASGIIVFALGANGVGIVLVGLAMLLYGLYVLFTRGSYWVSTLTYILPIFAIGLAVARR